MNFYIPLIDIQTFGLESFCGHGVKSEALGLSGQACTDYVEDPAAGIPWAISWS